MSLTIGIVGAGLIGELHADRLRHLPVTIAGFYDIHPAQSERLVGKFGGQVFHSVDDLARAVDVVMICTPLRYHREPVEIAAGHKKIIFCEKPLAHTIPEAQAIVDVCARAGVRLYVGHVLRFFKEYAHARRLVLDGVIGTPGTIRLLRAAVHPYYAGKRDYYKDLSQTGGAMTDGGIHDLDFARWTLGNLETVFARGITYRDDVAVLGDHGLVTLRYVSGVVGHLEGSWLQADGTFRQRFQIVGTDGVLDYDSQAPRQFYVTRRGGDMPFFLPATPLAQQDEPYFAQLEHFYNAVVNDSEFLVQPADAVEGVRMSLAIHHSMQTGQVVNVAEVH